MRYRSLMRSIQSHGPTMWKKKSERQNNVQTLLKKHKVVADELKNYQSTIDALYDQASALGEED